MRADSGQEGDQRDQRGIMSGTEVREHHFGSPSLPPLRPILMEQEEFLRHV